VPVDVTTLPTLYVFVDIQMDVDHLIDTVRLNFPAGTRLLLAGTIQFSSAVQLARARLAADYPGLDVPKCKPLSPGEVLGCTAPVVPAGAFDALVFVADGRFHLEAMMIANPTLPAYRWEGGCVGLEREAGLMQGCWLTGAPCCMPVVACRAVCQVWLEADASGGAAAG
jgi:2-(3-amino-3-carboxypropyl)histidine synthase